MKHTVSYLLSLSVFFNVLVIGQAGCVLEDVTGEWIFYESIRSLHHPFDCTYVPQIYREVNMKLSAGQVIENDWSVGTFTLTSDVSMELRVSSRYYLAEFKTIEAFGEAIMLCNETMIGISHDLNLRHWSCFYGQKINDKSDLKTHKQTHNDNLEEIVDRKYFESIVRKINRRRLSWTAKVYDKFVGLTRRQLMNYAGGKKSLPLTQTSYNSLKNNTLSLKEESNETFDWRDMDGTDFLSPVRDQGSCGSCYAFATAAMIEARLRIETNNELQTIISPQDILNCHQYSGGCDGGIPFLAAGEYGWHKGFAEESCVPYIGIDLPCSDTPCDRYYVNNDYEYIGGYLGEGNELEIIEALEEYGPVSAVMLVYSDFATYQDGVYVHNDGFEIGLHAVLIVGYGYDEEQDMKYWIVKNSWGIDWGEDGYFRIRRGTNECYIEGFASQAFPIPH